jgi:predicted metalloprotease
VLLVYTLITGDPSALLGSLLGGGTQQSSLSDERTAELTEFVSVILADTETVWNEVFEAYGKDYIEPNLVIFSGGVESACGTAGSSTGPFYCSADQKIYLDLEFFDTLSTRFKAPGDFAMAYVIAHEVGHHVQNQLGILEEVQTLRSQSSTTEANELSVRLELQADYLAGVWAHYVQGYGYLEAGDVDEAMNAASAIGDDTLQKEGQGYIVPDSFTHGTSAQRSRWFKKGLTYGDLENGDTFNTDTLMIWFK